MGLKLKTGEIGQLLDHSTSRLDPETIQKLQGARRTALLHQRTSQPASVLAWVEQHSLIHAHSVNHRSFNWGVAVLFALILFSGALYWQDVYEHDHSDLDIAILTDDLPVDMFVD
jgi:hypothetical protein